jgi:hypothetical protein
MEPRALRIQDSALYGFQRVTEPFATCPDAESVADAARAFGQEDDITVLTLTRLPVWDGVAATPISFATDEQQ